MISVLTRRRIVLGDERLWVNLFVVDEDIKRATVTEISDPPPSYQKPGSGFVRSTVPSAVNPSSLIV